MSNKTLTTLSYKNLISDIKSIIEQGKEKAESLIRSQMVLTYWQVGKRIVSEELTNNANYYSLIVEDLAKELQIDKSTLFRSTQLFKTYPNKPEVKNLTWSHYRKLLAIKGDGLRLELEQKAKEENWNVTKLGNKIKEIKENPSLTTPSKTKLKRPTDPNYLYKATIVNVIDGDTLLLNIDLGFQVIKKQRVRLSQIDAPELKTKEGKQSFNYLRDLSAKLNKVVIRTNKIDIYGRYLGDIFYQKTSDTNATQTKIFQTGTYLNQELLEKGFARLA